MFDYILSLGGTVFVPIIMIVIGLIFRIHGCGQSRPGLR